MSGIAMESDAMDKGINEGVGSESAAQAAVAKLSRAARELGRELCAEEIQERFDRAEAGLAGFKEPARAGSRMWAFVPLPGSRQMGGGRDGSWGLRWEAIREAGGWRAIGGSLTWMAWRPGAREGEEADGLASAAVLAWEGELGREEAEEARGDYFSDAEGEEWDRLSRERALEWIRLGWMRADEPLANDFDAPRESVGPLSALGRSARAAESEWVIKLLSLGADPNARGEGGRSALGELARYGADCVGSMETLKALLEAGADPLIRDESGRSPFESMGPADRGLELGRALEAIEKSAQEREALRAAAPAAGSDGSKMPRI